METSDNYVTKEQYDREISALNAQIQTLRAIVSSVEKHLKFRVGELERTAPPLNAVARPHEF